MTLKFFYTYLGIFLASSVFIGLAVKQLVPGFTSGGKRPYLFGIISSVMASGAAFLSSVISSHSFVVFWILALVYFLFGVIYLLIGRKYFKAGGQRTSKVIVGELIFGLSLIFFTIVIFSALQYFVADKGFLFYPMLISTFSFFIPLLFMYTYEAAMAIPAAEFKTWQYPLEVQNLEMRDEAQGEKLLAVFFELSNSPGDKGKNKFTAKAPEHMTLGELYYHLINHYNEVRSETPIVFEDRSHEAYHWWFRRKRKWYQLNRVLDPERSFRDNRIKESAVIVCERITNSL
ncbi:TssN family type VI secretion system protein [Paraflavitalea pollutisoli]|uniref:TssN family type VI secretion system protein n=1 Tax=Paraflavitalea pollutisoli TaxID=3034143 RepID=UPI0023EAC51C|nr:TssN family type VI secretion system protein [Paraflavitalea sp. H1-2-19X]